MADLEKVKSTKDAVADAFVRGIAKYADDPSKYDEEKFERDSKVTPLEGKAPPMPKLKSNGCCEEEKK